MNENDGVGMHMGYTYGICREKKLLRERWIELLDFNSV